jgi:hypothetical protein
MRTKANVRQRSLVYEFTPRGSTLRLLFLVTAIFIAVCVLDADFLAVPGSGFIDVTSVVPISVGVVPVSVPPLSVSSTIHVAIAAHLTIAMHSPVWTRLTIIAAHTVAVAAMHPPVVTHLTVVGPRLVAADPLIRLLRRFLVSLGRSSDLRSSCWSFSFLLGEYGVETRRGEQHGGKDKNTHESLLRRDVTVTTRSSPSFRVWSELINFSV